MKICCSFLLVLIIGASSLSAQQCPPVLDKAKLFLAYECINDSTVIVADSSSADLNGWQYSYDSSADGVTFGNIGGGDFEIFGIALKETESEVFIVINGNLAIDGYEFKSAKDGNIGWGDIFINLSESDDFDTTSNKKRFYAIKFAATNDSGVTETGVYGGSNAKSVTNENSGFTNWKKYSDHLTTRGYTPILGDLGSNQTYYADNISLNVIKSGSRLGDIEFLTLQELADLGFIQAQFEGVVTIGFKFRKRLIIDECGIIGGDGTSCQDCAGTACGTATIDQCGVCNGDGSSCLDCQGTPFGEKVVDQCGVCGGDGTSCQDCEGTPFGLLEVDQCGVCGGDGTSCTDCTGTPFGSAVIDQCGVCAGDGTSCLDCAGTPFGVSEIDECGVCGGDSRSCLECEEANITELLYALDGSAVSQRHVVLQSTKQLLKQSDLKRTDKRFIKRIRLQVEKLYNRNWEIAWSFPAVSTFCSGPVVCTAINNQELIEEYKSNSRLMLRYLRRAVHRLRKISKDKVLAKEFKEIGLDIYKQTSEKLETVPLNSSRCEL